MTHCFISIGICIVSAILAMHLLGIDTALAGDPEATSKKGAAERTDCPLILPD